MITFIIVVSIIYGIVIMYHDSKIAKAGFQIPAVMMGEHEDTKVLRRDRKTNLVWFPKSSKPFAKYYLIDVYFHGTHSTQNVTIKGRPAKRGHRVRNTLLFGVIGLAATHDKPATADKHYTRTVDTGGYGKLTLVNADLTKKYTVGFTGDKYVAYTLEKRRFNA